MADLNVSRVIGVMGPGEASDEELNMAYEIGRVIAIAGHTLLSGGMEGIMEASCRGAHEEGGLVIGVHPGTQRIQMNPYVTIPIITGMGSGRNFINALSSDRLIAIGARSAGTLTEIAHAFKGRVPVMIVGATLEARTYFTQLTDMVQFTGLGDKNLGEIIEFVRR